MIRNSFMNIINQTHQQQRTGELSYRRRNRMRNNNNFSMRLSSRIPMRLTNPIGLNNNRNNNITQTNMDDIDLTYRLEDEYDNNTNFSNDYMNQYMNHNNTYMYDEGNNYEINNYDQIFSNFIRTIHNFTIQNTTNTTFEFLNDEENDFINQSLEEYEAMREAQSGIPLEKQKEIEDNSILTKFSNIQHPKNNVCPILYEDFNENDNIYVLKCGHIIHEDKFFEYIKRFSYCPLCKFRL